MGSGAWRFLRPTKLTEESRIGLDHLRRLTILHRVEDIEEAGDNGRKEESDGDGPLENRFSFAPQGLAAHPGQEVKPMAFFIFGRPKHSGLPLAGPGPAQRPRPALRADCLASPDPAGSANCAQDAPRVKGRKLWRRAAGAGHNSSDALMVRPFGLAFIWAHISRGSTFVAFVSFCLSPLPLPVCSGQNHPHDAIHQLTAAILRKSSSRIRHPS